MSQQLERISQLPGFDESPSLAEESARLLLVEINPVLSAICTILQGGSSRHLEAMRTCQLVCLGVFVLSHSGGSFVYNIEL